MTSAKDTASGVGAVCVSAAQPIERRSRGGVSYWSVRQRLKTERGPAADHLCAGCGAPAMDWSYVGGAADERVHLARGYRYSLDLSRYVPRCRSCHRRATVAASPRRPRRALREAARAIWFYERGVGAPAIAKQLGVCVNAVYRELRANGVPIRPRGTRATVINDLPEPPEPDEEISHPGTPKEDKPAPENDQSRNQQTTDRTTQHRRGEPPATTYPS